MTKRIIAALFIPIPDKYKDIGQEYLTVYHKNRNYEDLSTENLGWYYRRDPDITKSDLPYYLKHTPSEINTVCNLLKSREWTIADAVSCLNCTPDTIASYMRNTKSYRDMMDDIVLVSRCNEETIEKFCRDLQNDNDASVLAIARRNNISSNTAYAIYHRKLYKHISDNYMWKDREYYLSEKMIRNICVSLQDKQPINLISETFGVGRSTVSRIRARKTHTDISKDYVW